MSESPQITILGKNTLIPAGAIIAVTLMLISAWGYLDGRFTEVLKGLDRQDRRLELLERVNSDRIFAVDMKLWLSELRRLNPNLQIPDLEKN